MEKTNNIYIDALKFGETQMQEGVSFHELTHHLKNCMNWKFEPKYLEYFRIWFHDNFYNNDISVTFKYGTEASKLSVIRQLHSLDEMKMVMTADAYEVLLDYEKLQQTRESSKKAHQLARWAIYISIAVGLIQILIPILFKD
jgi:hypothetical protein